MEKELKIIKKVILETAKRHGIDIEKIILFGSRARGESGITINCNLFIQATEG